MSLYKIDIGEFYESFHFRRKKELRIISGSARGHRLKTLGGLDTRPTADRVKESMFNMITGYVQEAKILDLFAGTGNLGVEALSRGASQAVFVDRNAEAIKVITDNLKHTKLIDKARIIKSECDTYFASINAQEEKFDIIFMDPPYSQEIISPTLAQIFKWQLLNKGGIIVVESDKEDALPEVRPPYAIMRSKTYGRTVVTIIIKDDDK